MREAPEAQDQLIALPGGKIGRLRARYKRFFADIEIGADIELGGTAPGSAPELITAHCPNGGKMLGLLDAGNAALVTDVSNPNNRLRYRLEAIREGDTWVGVNTQWPNRLIPKAIADGLIPQVMGYASIKPEVKYGRNSRIDLFASGHAVLPDAYIEIKNCHYSRAPGLAEFPDCEAARSTKHMYELIDMVAAGYHAVVVFCIQRDDVERFDVARDLDPDFGRAYDAARAAGVEIVAVSFSVSPAGWRFARELRVI